MSELEALQHVCGPARDVVSQTLESILASHTRLQVNSQTLHQELGGREQELTTLKKDRSELCQFTDTAMTRCEGYKYY